MTYSLNEVNQALIAWSPYRCGSKYRWGKMPRTKIKTELRGMNTHLRDYKLIFLLTLIVFGGRGILSRATRKLVPVFSAYNVFALFLENGCQR